MKRHVITLAAILSLPFFSSAQSNYKPGYVINLKGDTLKGFIDYQEWEKTPRHITFKDNTAAAQRYSAQNIRGFGVTGLEYYEANIIKISLDPVDFATAGRVMKKAFKTDTVFLRLLNTGRMLSLYSYDDEIKNRYYLLEHDNAVPQELEYHLYVDSSEVVKHVRRYRTQLQSVAERNNISNNKLKDRILSADYKQDDLSAVVNAMNGNNTTQLTEKSQFGTRFFAGAGVFYTDMSFSGDIQYGDNYNFFPKLDAGIDFLINKNIQRLFLRLEVSATGDEHFFNNTSERSQLKVKQYTASLIPQVYYSPYNSSAFKVFVAGGIAVNFSSYPTRYYSAVGGLDHTPVSPTQAPTLINNFPDYHTLWVSFVVKAGVILNKKVEIYAGCTPSTTITNDIPLAGNVVSYQAGVNFLFGAK